MKAPRRQVFITGYWQVTADIKCFSLFNGTYNFYAIISHDLFIRVAYQTVMIIFGVERHTTGCYVAPKSALYRLLSRSKLTGGEKVITMANWSHRDPPPQFVSSSTTYRLRKRKERIDGDDLMACCPMTLTLEISPNQWKALPADPPDGELKSLGNSLIYLKAVSAVIRSLWPECQHGAWTDVDGQTPLSDDKARFLFPRIVNE